MLSNWSDVWHSEIMKVLNSSRNSLIFKTVHSSWFIAFYQTGGSPVFKRAQNSERIELPKRDCPRRKVALLVFYHNSHQHEMSPVEMLAIQKFLNQITRLSINVTFFSLPSRSMSRFSFSPFRLSIGNKSKKS
jgi:hypothetical protein